MNEAKKLEAWPISAAITVDHGQDLASVGDLEETLTSALKCSVLRSTHVVDVTRRNGTTSQDERRLRLQDGDWLYFSAKGTMESECYLGREAMTVCVNDERFAWPSISERGGDASIVLLFANQLMVSFGARFAIISASERYSPGGGVKEMACEGLSVEEILLRQGLSKTSDDAAWLTFVPTSHPEGELGQTFFVPLKS